MAPSPRTKVFATEDCAIQRLLTDSSGGTTYGPMIDVPGIKQVGITPQIETKQNRGDNALLDSNSVLIGAEISWGQAHLSYPALEVFLGGEWTTEYTQEGGVILPEFRMTWKTPASGSSDVGGDIHFEVTKGSVSAYTLGTAEEDYQAMTGTAQCVMRLSDRKLFGILPHEVATGLVSA